MNFSKHLPLWITALIVALAFYKFAPASSESNTEAHHGAASSRSLLEDSNQDLAVATVVFSVCAFVGNFGVALTGFGMAIFYLFVYTIADVAGLVDCSRCGIKDAVFYQSLALGAAVPLLFYKARNVIKGNLDKQLLMTFIPATIAGTPIGKYAQEEIDNEIVRVIVGATITAVLGYELYKLVIETEWYKKRESGEPDQTEGTRPRRRVSEATRVRISKANRRVRASLASADYGGEGMFDETEDTTPPEAEKKVGFDEEQVKDKEEEDENFTDENVTANDSSPEDQDSQNKVQKRGDGDGKSLQKKVPESSLKKFIAASKRNLSGEEIPEGPALYIVGFIMGFLSGFLGGLIGIRGPPLIVFFLHFPYPKPVVRANGIMFLVTNVSIRVVYYIIEDISGKREQSWFTTDLWYLYISVMFFGLLGVPAGNWVSKKVNQSQFKAIIAFMLLLSGLSNLIKGSIDMSK